MKRNQWKQENIRLGTHGEDYGSWMSNPVFYIIGGIMEQVHRVVLSHLDYDGQEKILEVGCGSGALIIRAALTWSKAKVIGIDYWGAVYTYSKALCEKNAVSEGVASRCVFQHGDAKQLDFPDESFDVVISNYVYHNVSEHYPQILYDKKALELKNKLPSDLIEQKKQNQYTLLASASRSANMDRFVRSFLERRPDGVIVQLGCGLETTYHRCDNGKTHWYAVDLPHVIQYRRGLLPEPEREFYISGDAFVKDWIIKVRNDVPDAPVLVTAGGLLHYFEENKVISLLRMIGQSGNMEVVFDTVNKKGMAMMQKKYMKQVGHADAQMFFYVDAAKELAAKIRGNVKVIAEEPYYRYIPKNGLKLSTKVSMAVSDQFKMVKMIHLKL